MRMARFLHGGPLFGAVLIKVINSRGHKVLAGFLSLPSWLQLSLLTVQLWEQLPRLDFLPTVHLLCKTSGSWSLKSPHEMTLIMSKPPQLHMFGRRQSGAMVKKITLLKSYFPFKYLSKFVNTFCCWWNDPPLTFQFIIAVLLMRPQKMEMRPINMLRVKVRNRNSVCTLWVIFQYHQHSKQQGSVALQHKHLA